MICRSIFGSMPHSAWQLTILAYVSAVSLPSRTQHSSFKPTNSLCVLLLLLLLWPLWSVYQAEHGIPPSNLQSYASVVSLPSRTRHSSLKPSVLRLCGQFTKQNTAFLPQTYKSSCLQPEPYHVTEHKVWSWSKIGKNLKQERLLDLRPMRLDLRLPRKLLVTHLSGKSSTIKPSMETTGTPSATSPDLCRELMRSSAPFSPAVKPTGWAAIVACPSCKQMSAEWSTLQRILLSSWLEPYKPFFVG